MIDHDDLTVLRRYQRREAAKMLNIPDTWLRVWVTQGAVPHQRSGKPGPHQRGVWSTYCDILAIGRMLPDLMTGRQANSRAECPADDTPADAPAAVTSAQPPAAVTDTADAWWAQFEELRSLRTDV